MENAYYGNRLNPIFGIETCKHETQRIYLNIYASFTPHHDQSRMSRHVSVT
jgi:hypothetical protein